MKQNLILRRFIRLGIPAIAVVLIVTYWVLSYNIASEITKCERMLQVEDPTAYALRFEEVEFLSRRGDVTLDGWYILGKSHRPTLIFVHGLGGVRSGDNAVALASKIVVKGYNVLMFDLRGHGTSGGELISCGYFEQQDVLGAFDFLVSRGIPSESIGVIGFSMGAGTAVLAAAKEPAIYALVADSPYARVSDLIAQEIAHKTALNKRVCPVFVPGVIIIGRLLYGIDIGALVPEEAVQLLPYPVLVIHGIADSRIPFEHGVRIYEAAHPDSSIWLVPEVDHVDAYITYPDEYVDRILDYFDRRLGAQ